MKYGVIDSLQTKVDAIIKDGQFAITAFGGVIGVGKAVVSGLGLCHYNSYLNSLLPCLPTSGN